MSEKARAGTLVTRLAAAGSGAALSTLLFSVHMVIPPAGLIFGLLAPFPAVFSRLRHGRATALIIVLAAATLLTWGTGFQVGLLYLLQCSVVALVMPELLLSGMGATRSIAWTTAANLLVYLLAILGFMLVSDIAPARLYSLATTEISNGIGQAMAIYEKAHVSGEELATVKRAMTMAADLMLKIFPALTSLMLMLMAGCNLALAKRFSSRCGVRLRVGEFRQFRNPELLIWLLIVAGFAMLTDMPPVTTPALNVLVVLGVLYFLQGMAVISSILQRLASAGILRMALYLVLVFQPYTAALVAAIGIFDLWGDFRTPRQQENL